MARRRRRLRSNNPSDRHPKTPLVRGVRSALTRDKEVASLRWLWLQQSLLFMRMFFKTLLWEDMILSSAATTPCGSTGTACPPFWESNSTSIIAHYRGCCIFYLPEFRPFGSRISWRQRAAASQSIPALSTGWAAVSASINKPLRRRFCGDTSAMDRSGRHRERHRRFTDELFYHDGAACPAA